MDRLALLSLIGYIFYVHGIVITLAQDGKCTTDRDCKVGAVCHRISRLCICENKSSSYPSCLIQEGNSCKQKCSELQYCDLKTATCMCRYGGMTLDICCKRSCGKFQVCNQGACKCAYGSNELGGCRRCMKICKKEERCASTGSSYGCRKIECGKHCGAGSKCVWDNNKVICTRCGPGHSLVLKKCIEDDRWGSWGKCSATCGKGVRERRRKCSAKSRCKGKNVSEVEPCTSSVKCVGKWSQWGSWSACSASCSGGEKVRKRTCRGSANCKGDETQKKECNTIPCIGIPGFWGPWSSCSVTCGKGKRTRKRPCTNAIKCVGNAVKTETCTKKPCSVDCGWCNGDIKIEQIPGQCKYQRIRLRTPGCPERVGNGAPCKGKPRMVLGDATQKGETQYRDFHSPYPEKNRFSAKCEGGCISIHEVIHWCKRKIQHADTEKVRKICEGKEKCEFTPGPSFFGDRDCKGVQKTFVSYSCNNGHLTTNHIDGKKTKKIILKCVSILNIIGTCIEG